MVKPDEKPALPCPNWVWLHNSNAHVANDKIWFGDDYMPFDSVITDASGHQIPVIGIGTVDLPTKRSPFIKSGARAHATLQLKKVLHAPSFRCNVVGNGLLDDYDVDQKTRLRRKEALSDGQVTQLVDGEVRQRVAYFKPLTLGAKSHFLELKISGPPRGPRTGPSVLDADERCTLHALWPPGEREKLEAAEAANVEVPSPDAGRSPNVYRSSAPLTPTEKEWLKANYKNEYKFLKIFGLSIYKPDDREEGRAIIRTFMDKADDSDSLPGMMASFSLVDYPSTDNDEDELDSEPDAHLADYNFTTAELAWIKAEWGSSSKFMSAYNLKFYSVEDGEDAQVLIKLLMSQEGGF
ncbi:hypothetical protein G7046_g7312 [Stylonectria norvegica]|nr:hypothetical protein G7046_g7312 [Stylonectria norvegica]